MKKRRPVGAALLALGAVSLPIAAFLHRAVSFPARCSFRTLLLAISCPTMLLVLPVGSVELDAALQGVLHNGGFGSALEVVALHLVGGQAAGEDEEDGKGDRLHGRGCLRFK